MKDKTYNPQPLILTEGSILEYSYDSFETLIRQNSKNWKQGCAYMLEPIRLRGQYLMLHLTSMQIGFGKRKGAAMYNVSSAKDSLSIAVIIMCKGKSCFDRMKFREGDILFFDDSHSHNWIADCQVEHAVITIRKGALPAELSNFSKLIGHSILDTDARLLTTLYEIRKRMTDDSFRKNTKSYREAENEILTVLMGLLSEQTPVIPRLTAGEKITLDIRDQVFEHMDGKIDIGSLAKQHQCTKQTLVVNFKSLFGFTPQRFLRLLKLNHVHYELLHSYPDQSTVSRIASKWGFMHMGRFSAYYAELFGQKPSQTLKDSSDYHQYIEDNCVLRKEEL